jgi:hypothetical protein
MNKHRQTSLRPPLELQGSTPVCRHLLGERSHRILQESRCTESSVQHQDHADGNPECCRGIDASEEAIGGDSNLICLNAAHGVAQVAIYSQVASQGNSMIATSLQRAAMQNSG